MKIEIPCKIGDTAWAYRIMYDKRKAQEGKITEIFFNDKMELCVAIKGVRRGIWGKTIFATKEELESGNSDGD